MLALKIIAVLGSGWAIFWLGWYCSWMAWTKRK